MNHLLFIETIAYFGIIGLEIYWQIHGVRNERRFALLQVASLSLIIITTGLGAYFSSFHPYPFGLIALSIGVIVFAAIGYPLSRWIYRQAFPPN
ncbi:MAG TPA: hypothetical protein VJM08_09770 [Anaerolineales bacterium]|nr:hypothetical protein [Anaerolineales bacterium]